MTGCPFESHVSWKADWPFTAFMSDTKGTDYHELLSFPLKFSCFYSVSFLVHILCKSLESAFISIYFAKKNQNRCWSMTQKRDRKGKNSVCIIITSLKVNVWYDNLYSSTQPELSCQAFLEIIFGIHFSGFLKDKVFFGCSLLRLSHLCFNNVEVQALGRLIHDW